MLTAIRHCEDVMDPESTNIHILSEISGVLLKSSIRHQNNLAEYPGEIFLSSLLFTRTKRHESQGSAGSSAGSSFFSPRKVWSLVNYILACFFELLSLTLFWAQSMLPADFALVKSPRKVGFLIFSLLCL